MLCYTMFNNRISNDLCALTTVYIALYAVQKYYTDWPLKLKVVHTSLILVKFYSLFNVPFMLIFIHVYSVFINYINDYRECKIMVELI